MKKLMIAVGVIAVGGAGWYFTRGLSSTATMMGRTAAEHSVPLAREEIESKRAELEKLVKSDPAYLGAAPEVKAARESFTKRLAALEVLEKGKVAELKALMAKDDPDTRRQVLTLSNAIRDGSQQQSKGLYLLVDGARKAKKRKARFGAVAKKAKARVEAAKKALLDEALPTALAKAVKACPKKKDGLAKEVKSWFEVNGGIAKQGEKLDAATKSSPPDINAALPLAEAINKGPVPQPAEAMKKRFEALPHSKDVILLDLREEDSGSTMRTKEVIDGKAQPPRWESISAATFASHTEHLGMSIYSKPACADEAEAVTVAIPPGYAYVGDEHYGEWEGEGDEAVWRWRPEHEAMAAVFWRPRYVPVHRRTHRSYVKTVKTRKAYYGPKREWGRAGAAAAGFYLGSTFVKQGPARAARSKRRAVQAKAARARAAAASRAAAARRSAARSRTYRGRSGK